MKSTQKTIQFAGRTLSFRINEVAQQATTSVLTQYGETTILTTVVVGKEKPELDYFPLVVEYVEKLYAGGRIKGSRWIKREGRPNDSAILTARLIDRSVRPLFSESFRKEVQVVNTILSIDGVNSPEIVAALSTSCALSLCEIPWKGPVSTLKIGHLGGDNGEKGNFVINPTPEEETLSTLDLVVSSTEDKVVMIECRGEEVNKDKILEGIKLAQIEGKKLIKLFLEMRKDLGISEVKEKQQSEEANLLDKVLKKYKAQFVNLLLSMADKETVGEAGEELFNLILNEFELKETQVKSIFQKIFKKLMQELVLQKKQRVDGRKFNEVRPLTIRVGVLPRTHGSAIFKRGTTEVLSIATLGSLSLQQWIENPEGEFLKRYIHHYYMPPYSVGEIGRVGFPSRREIGHGALAEKALEPVLPSEEIFPYTIRVVSEVLSSNGSTSMASTCGSSLALMDAGVPIKAPVGGVAMGIVRSDDKYQILTDIIGLEDFFGEMDLKIAGTTKGITAIQLDVKREGLTEAMLTESFLEAEKARLHILKAMSAVIETPRKELSKYAPKVSVFSVPQDKVGMIIGPGGNMIKKIITETGCEIDISEDNKVSVSGVDSVSVDAAVNRIKNLIKEYKIGEVYTGKIVRVLPFGIIVELSPGKEGLVHVTRMGMGYVKDVGSVFEVGQSVAVEIEEIDNKGRLKMKLCREKK